MLALAKRVKVLHLTRVLQRPCLVTGKDSGHAVLGCRDLRCLSLIPYPFFLLHLRLMGSSCGECSSQSTYWPLTHHIAVSLGVSLTRPA